MYFCDLCGKEVVDEVRHLEYHKENPSLCNICGKSKKNERMLFQHIKKYHSEMVSCNICSKEFVNNQNLKRHILDVHSVNKYTCDQCDKSYSRKYLFSMKK